MFSLPELGYAYDALEPHIDQETMKIHHDKHHLGYIDKLNLILEKHQELQGKSAEELVKSLDSISEEVRQGVQNHAGGHVNHSFFWKILKKDVEPQGEILTQIKETFGSLDEFKKQFKEKGLTLFGSGWVWLVLTQNNQLEIIQTKNQDSPLTLGKVPLIGADVWEHGYYLCYQNRRNEYLDAFFNVINWEVVNDFYSKAKQ